MKEGLIFGTLDKVSDDILYFGSGVTLRFNVVLSRKKKDGTRDFMHKEYGYPSKYINHEYSYSIRRSFDFYLSIDIREDFDNSVQIRAKDMIILRTRLNEIIRWFGELFKLKNKKLQIIGNYKPIIITNLAEQKWLKFVPIIIEYDNGQQKEGIRMIINSDTSYVDINIDRFMEFIYYISSMDMYQCALSVLSYFNPEIGKDVVYFENSISRNPNLEESEEEAKGFGKIRPQLKDQKPNVTRQKSFFDKKFDEIDNL